MKANPSGCSYPPSNPTRFSFYKAELIRSPARHGPWRTVEDVEHATVGWVHWHNHQRLHGYLDDLPPAEFEGRFYATQQGTQALVEIK